MYRGGRPNRVALTLNRFSAILFSWGLVYRNHAATLQVVGRRSGRPLTLPVAIADLAGERYLVSFLGERANWVANVRAAGGKAVLLHGRDEAVVLKEVEVAARAPILRRYLAVAPGGRPHIPVDRRAPLAEFERIAARYPVFHLTGNPSTKE
jgi:deazaflavin-dependent oxidoreductase (nitroreductase family)